MSRHFSSSSKVAPSTKMHCKVCQDHGLAASVFTGHNVRTGGKITCMTLLSSSCLNCGKKGHSEKYCTVKDKPTKEFKMTDDAAPKAPVISKKVGGAFADLLCDDDSSEDEDDKKPAHCATPGRTIKKAMRMNWAELSDDEDN